MENRYVAFIDVLGFSDLVFKKDHGTLRDYFETINSVITRINETKKTVDSILFSDCVILISYPGEDDFRSLLTAIQTIQANLILKEIIFRGAVSYGKLYYNPSENILVGEGYIKAYLLEKEAIYPRVIIDPIIIPVLANNKNEFVNKFSSEHDISGLIHIPISMGNFLRKRLPDDDSIFVNYLGKIVKDNKNIEDLNLIFEFIKKKIYSDFKTQGKYTWLRNYFSEIAYRSLVLDQEPSPKRTLLSRIYSQIDKI